MLQKFKPCYSRTKRDVRLNLFRDIELQLSVGRGEACAAVAWFHCGATRAAASLMR